MNIESSLQKDIDTWFEYNVPGSTDYVTIKNLVDTNDMESLKIVMGKRLGFGTAGIRGKMGPGWNCMNDLVIIQTTQGLAHHYLNEAMVNGSTEQTKKCGVVIGFDARHNSKRWSKLAALVFRSLGFKVYLFSDITPTPWVPFAVLRYATVCGIMITASHNPKEDNGYKVYGSDGVQIRQPTDADIQKSIYAHSKPEMEDFMNFNPDSLSKTQFGTESSLLIDPWQDVTNTYVKGYISNEVQHLIEHGINAEELKNLNTEVLQTATCITLSEAALTLKSSAVICYSAMHGVGAKFVEMCMDEIGLGSLIKSTPEHRDPDPEFPTVKFPNPEEGKSAFDYPIAHAESVGSRHILANDPDADRLAVAEKNGNSWRIFNGNELGTLFGWWLRVVYKSKNPDVKASQLAFISSAVSSKMLKSIADMDGHVFEETLTGFKWLAHKSKEMEAKSVEDGLKMKVLLAYEEAIGFMCGSGVPDKDGVMAAVHMACMICYLNTIGETLASQLNRLYKRYGYHCVRSSYFIIKDSSSIPSLFHSLRNQGECFNNKTYHKYIKTQSGKIYNISYVRDLTTGFDTSKPNMTATLPLTCVASSVNDAILSSSQMVTYGLDNGVIFTLRTSGTEPKFKYYVEYCASPDDNRSQESIQTELTEITDCIIESFICPEKFDLQQRA